MTPRRARRCFVGMPAWELVTVDMLVELAAAYIWQVRRGGSVLRVGALLVSFTAPGYRRAPRGRQRCG